MRNYPSAESNKGFWAKVRRNLDSVIIFLIALAEVVYTSWHLMTHAHTTSEHLLLGVLAGNGVLFGVAGYERIMQREKIELKIGILRDEVAVLKEMLNSQRVDLNILENMASGYQLISGLENITIAARDGIREAKEIIRSTSFICPMGADVGTQYYMGRASKGKKE